MRRALLLVLLAPLVGCNRASDLVRPDPTLGLGGDDSLAIAVSVTPSAITPGQSARVDAMLTNRRGSPLTLHLASGCQLLYEVLDDAGRPAPENGGFACTAALTTVTLAPHETVQRSFAWTATELVYPPISYRPRPPVP